jgi:WhiB family redox-sensing transcriptional regulator
MTRKRKPHQNHDGEYVAAAHNAALEAGLDSLGLNDSSWEWIDAAACSGHDTSLWFGKSSTPNFFRDAKIAKAICATCPVQTRCLEFAMVNMIDHGIWGGRNQRERHTLRRIRKTTQRTTQKVRSRSCESEEPVEQLAN